MNPYPSPSDNPLRKANLKSEQQAMNRKLTSSCAISLLLATLTLNITGCGEKTEAALEMVKDRIAADKANPKQEAGHSEAEQTKEAGEGKVEARHEEHAGEEHADGKEGKGKQEEGGHKEEGGLKLSDEEVATAGIKVEKLEMRKNAEQIAVTGTIKANQDRLAHVQTRVPGRVVTVEVSLGDQVEQGQTLATLDSVELNEAGTAYLQSQSELSLAEANFKRAQNLFTDKIIPQKDYLSARAEMEKTRAAHRAAVSKLNLFGVNPATVGKDSTGLVFPVRSPFAGTIIEKDAVLGDLAEPGKSLFTVADLSTLWIETSIFDKDLSKIKAGLPASVTVAAYPQEIFRGRITYIGSMVDEESRTVSARVELANTDNRLKAGMFANVSIESDVGAAALLVPDEAVVFIKGQATVFVAEHGGFEPRSVMTGERADGRVALQSGVKAGEAVVVSGAYALKSRMLKSELGEGHAH